MSAESSQAQGAAALPIRVDARVVENRREGANARVLCLHVDDWPGFEAGQFLMLSPGARDGATRWDPLLPRPMAVYRARCASGAADVEVLYKVSGRGTRLLAEALPGQHVRAVGPLGRPFPLPEPGERAILVGGGTGIASLYELAARALERVSASQLRVLLGARTSTDLMGEADLSALGAPPRIATEDGSRGESGLVTEALEAELADAAGARTHVYACGPTPMMRRCAEIAAAHGARCTVSLENHMACGFGVCLGCAAPRVEGGYALVCRQGPVFDAAEISWEALP